MYQRYMLSLGQLQKNLPPDVPIERNLYHGTQKETISNIIRGSGFNRAYAGKHGTFSVSDFDADFVHYIYIYIYMQYLFHRYIYQE